jgi:hypothetical protein
MWNFPGSRRQTAGGIFAVLPQAAFEQKALSRDSAPTDLFEISVLSVQLPLEDNLPGCVAPYEHYL